MASVSAVLSELDCVISFPKLPYPPLSGLLHVKSIGVRKAVLPLASLKLLMHCTVSPILWLVVARSHVMHISHTYTQYHYRRKVDGLR